MPVVNQHLYQIFGVGKYAQKLIEENKQGELAVLQRSVAKFILMKSIAELPDEALGRLEGIDIKDGINLYTFLSKQIPNFKSKIKAYGADYKRTLIRTRP